MLYVILCYTLSRPLFNFKISVVLAGLRRRNFRFSSGDIQETEDEKREQANQEDDHTRYQQFSSPPVCV